jgi:hypothetical protein
MNTLDYTIKTNRENFLDPYKVVDRQTGELLGFVARRRKKWRAMTPDRDVIGDFYRRDEAADQVSEAARRASTEAADVE